MDELKYALLAEVYGRMEAELIKSYLEAHGIDVELFQESIGQNIYPTTIDTLGNVQIFVEKDKMEEAVTLLKEIQHNLHGSAKTLKVSLFEDFVKTFRVTKE